MPAKKVEKVFDPALLQKMQEPLTVRIEKVRGNQKEPISLPPKGSNNTPGSGYSRDDIMMVEKYILDTSGGGHYEGRVTDADGNTMLWGFGWDPRTYPERVAPDSSSNTNMPPPAPAPQPGQNIPLPPNPMQASMPLGSAGSFLQAPPPQYYQQMAQGYPQQQPFQYFPSPQMPQMPQWPWGPGTPTPPPATPIRATQSDEIKVLQAELAKVREANIQKEYQAALERQREEADKQITSLRDELRRLAEAGKSTETIEARKYREEAERQRQENERIRQEAERDRIEQRHREEMAALKQQMDAMRQLMENPRDKDENVRRLEEQMRRAEEKAERERAEQRHREELRALEASINKGPDPIVEFMKENTRMQQETSRELARHQRETTERITQTMINPGQMMDMIQRNQGGMDNVLKSIIGSFGGAFETYRAMMESMIQAQGGGQSGGLAMVQEGLGRFSEMASQYLDYQRTKAVADSQAKQAAAQAQAQAAQSMGKRTRVHTPPPPQQAAGDLAGADVPSNGQSGQPEPSNVVEINDSDAPTEADMFGDPSVLDAVKKLRMGVANGALNPEQAMAALMQGIQYVDDNEIEVPAFALIFEQRFADLIDILLPDAPPEYRIQCAQILTAMLTGSGILQQDGDQATA